MTDELQEPTMLDAVGDQAIDARLEGRQMTGADIALAHARSTGCTCDDGRTRWRPCDYHMGWRDALDWSDEIEREAKMRRKADS